MEILQLSDSNVEEVAKKAANVLKRGGVIIYPTDTVYGLGVDVHNPSALAKLRQIKDRETKKPISIVVAEYPHAEMYAHMHPTAQTFAERFLPGPLTIVLPAKSHTPLGITLNDTVGIRVPNHPFTQALAKLFPKGITATSANKSGRTPEASIVGILEQLRHAIPLIDLVIEEGEKPHKPSTVISFTDDRVNVLREGALSRADLGL